jgi:4-hydroxy-3-methylbut-2-enyl diphosphate reductase
VKRLASSVDAIIVVGGRNSGNTQRLFEIAKQTGKPAYHIESETELEGLDTQSLASARHIGITAGASTPNWIIKRVYRTLEALPYKSGRGWRRTFFNIQRVLLLTNLYVSLGAGCLSYACTKLMGIGQYFPNFIIAILYVQSMHILNHLTGKQADQYNDPDRAFFYNKHKLLLSVLAIMAGGVGLIIAYTIEQIPFVILLAMSILGLSYNLRIVPERFSYLRYRRIRDIPGSKTLLIAMAWGIVTSLFPSLSISEKMNLSIVPVFLWSTGMVFVRTAFFDTLDMQGDRIVGKETIPILLGEKRTMRLLKSILAVTFAIILLASAFSIISSLGFALSICPVFLFLVLLIYEKGHLIPGIRLEFLVESLFVLAGSITLLWSALLINL